MTVTNSNNKVSYTSGDGQTTFAYTFKIFADADLRVYVNGSLQTSGYAITGTGEVSGGNVVFDTGLDTDDAVVIQRVLSLTQGADYVENDAFPAETHERALDRLTFALQQLQEEINRCVKFSTTVTDIDSTEVDGDADARANKLFSFDGNGDLNTSHDIVDYASGELAMLSLSDDSAPGLGGDLDTNGHNIDNITPTELGQLANITGNIQAQIDSITSDVVEDTTPQLGGDLDLNNHDITGTGDIPAGNLTGDLPALDGSALTGISLPDFTDTHEFTSNGTVVVPAGCTKAYCLMCGGGGGGGGGGGSGTYSGGGGGGGAGFVLEHFTVVPGDTLTVTIGAGGPYGSEGANGSSGTATTITGLAIDITTGGGAGGVHGNSTRAGGIGVNYGGSGGGGNQSGGHGGSGGGAMEVRPFDGAFVVKNSHHGGGGSRSGGGGGAGGFGSGASAVFDGNGNHASVNTGGGGAGGYYEKRGGDGGSGKCYIYFKY